MATKTILPSRRFLDVGGTFIKCADGRQVPVSSAGSRDSIMASLRKAVGPLEGLESVGVAIPGPFDFKTGTFLMKHKFAAVYGERFCDLAGLPESVDIRFHHDVNVVLRGIVKKLQLQDKNVALVTLGTGLGFALALKGEVLYNPMGSPLRNLWNLPLDGGVLEDAVSGRGITVAYARQTGDALQSAYSVARRAYAGHPVAMQVYRHVGELLGEALKVQADELSLDMVFMGGQISKSLSLMIEPLQEALPGVEILPSPEGAVFDGLASLFESK